MGKSRNLLSHSSVLHNGGTPTLSRCLWDGHALSYNCHTDTMTAGEIRTLAKIQKRILMVFVCDYKTFTKTQALSYQKDSKTSANTHAVL
jgi:hypothetical protein